MNKILLLPVLFLLSLVSFSAAQIPQTMSYQGVLTGATGNPVADGTVSLTFKLYDVVADGAALWQETQSLEVKNGIFNATLGSVIPLNLPFDKPYWLGITVGQDTEMTPRIALTASPYSLGATATVTEPAAGQSFVVRNVAGDATHVLNADGGVVHAGTATFNKGLRLAVSDSTLAFKMAGGDSGIIIYDPDGVAILSIGGNPNITNLRTPNGVSKKGLQSRDMWTKNVELLGGEVFANSFHVWVPDPDEGYYSPYNAVSIDSSGMEISGEISAESFHLVNDFGDTLLNINSDGTVELMNQVSLTGSNAKLVFPDGSVQTTASDGTAAAGWSVDSTKNLIMTDRNVVIKDSDGEVVTRFNTDGTSIHSGNEVFQGGIEIQSFLDGKKVIELNQNGLAIFNRFTGELTTEFLHDGRSLHNGTETFEGDVILTGTNGKGIKLVDAAGNTLAGFGRIDLDTGQNIGVFGKAQNPGDLAAVFEGPVDVLGEITASSLHIVNTAGDSLTDFFADGTSRHRGLETYEAGIKIVNSDGSTAIDLQPNTDPNTQYALTINGNIMVNGLLQATSKDFRIDHPLDPENKYLLHTSIESPDMKTVYDGVVTLDDTGEAVVEMPEWFEALNEDFRYQLTCIGGFAQVYVAEEILGNRFKIAGGAPGLKVSWQVTGIRHDAWAKSHRQPIEGYKLQR